MTHTVAENLIGWLSSRTRHGLRSANLRGRSLPAFLLEGCRSEDQRWRQFLRSGKNFGQPRSGITPPSAAIALENPYPSVARLSLSPRRRNSTHLGPIFQKA